MASTRVAKSPALLLWQSTFPSTAARTGLRGHARHQSTLPNNPHIVRKIVTNDYELEPKAKLKINQYYFPTSTKGKSLLTYLPTNPPNATLSIGTTTAIPPTPQSFTPNSSFTPILESVLKNNAPSDPQVKAQAMAYAAAERGSGLGLHSAGGAGSASAGSGASSLGLPANHPANQSQRMRDKRSRRPGPGTSSGTVSTSHSSPAATAASNKPFPSTGGGGPTSAQGGMAGLDTAKSRGGWIHVSDNRNPPDWGRIAWPEDIFGSLEVDGEGNFVDGTGNWQSSGTYRIITNEGILGLTDFLRGKLVERLKHLEKSN